MAARKLAPIHPGEVLALDFLEPLGISQYRLAKDISVPARRINEIGTRMAMGATPTMIIRMILRETAIVTALGLIAGLLAASLSTKVIALYLFGLGRMDYMTITFALGLVSVVALAAGYIPAARAGKVDPVTALRHE